MKFTLYGGYELIECCIKPQTISNTLVIDMVYYLLFLLSTCRPDELSPVQYGVSVRDYFTLCDLPVPTFCMVCETVNAFMCLYA